MRGKACIPWVCVCVCGERGGGELCGCVCARGVGAVCVCVCARGRTRALRIVSMDKILRITNTLIIIVN